MWVYVETLIHPVHSSPRSCSRGNCRCSPLIEEVSSPLADWWRNPGFNQLLSVLCEVFYVIKTSAVEVIGDVQQGHI